LRKRKRYYFLIVDLFIIIQTLNEYDRYIYLMLFIRSMYIYFVSRNVGTDSSQVLHRDISKYMVFIVLKFLFLSKAVLFP